MRRRRRRFGPQVPLWFVELDRERAPWIGIQLLPQCHNFGLLKRVSRWRGRERETGKRGTMGFQVSPDNTKCMYVSCPTSCRTSMFPLLWKLRLANSNSPCFSFYPSSINASSRLRAVRRWHSHLNCTGEPKRVHVPRGRTDDAESSESARRTKGGRRCAAFFNVGRPTKRVGVAVGMRMRERVCECVSPSGNNAILFKSHFAAGALVGLPSSSSGDLSFPHSLSLTK